MWGRYTRESTSTPLYINTRSDRRPQKLCPANGIMKESNKVTVQV